MNKNKRFKHKQKGQSTIEFLIGFVFALGFLIMFSSLTYNFAISYLAQYATFMTARSYLIADNGNNNESSSYQYAKQYALQTYALYPISFLGGNMSIRGLDAGTNRREKLYTGAMFSFNTKLFSSFLAPSQVINWVSEAYLGKEPVRSVCLSRICEIIQLKIGLDPCQSTEIGSHSTIFDDGC